MRADQTKMDVLRRAVAAVTAEGTGVSFGAIRTIPGKLGGAADLVVRAGDRKRTYRVEIKQGVLSATALPALETLARKGAKDTPLLVVASQIGPSVAKLLREHGFAFLDEAGNAFLSEPGLHVSISGKSAGVKRVATGLHRQNAIKVLFTLLADPLLDKDPSAAFINHPVRSLAKAADVALGSVGGVLDSLRAMGFLLDDSGARRLVERERLIELWATDYLARLRHRLVRQRYRAASVLNWEQWPPLPPGARWGGEVAGARLTRHLRPDRATIYASALPDAWIVQTGLQTDPDGNVEVLSPFWGDDLEKRWASAPKGFSHDCVHPLVVYADLLTDNDDRKTETAKRIYDLFLRQLAASD